MKRMKLFAAVLLLATIVAGNDTWAVSALGKKDTRPAESPKFFSGNANPLSDFIFVADPTSVEYNGRLYVYGTNDTQQLDSVGKDGKNTYQYIHSLVMLSTDDMVNWTYHGLIDVKALSPWGIASWAPSIVSRVEADGKTHFYLYYSNSGAGVGVLTSTSPVGPWTDPLGRMLVSQFTQGLGNCKAPFDPGAVIDDMGTGWLSFGGGGKGEDGTDYMPGDARIVRLGKDLISLDSEVVEIKAPYHFEANELNYWNGTWIYTYNTDWNKRTEWPHQGVDKPSICCMSYMTSHTPLDTDSWKYVDNYFKNPGDYGMDFSNNHTHLQKYKGDYYLFYHNMCLQEHKGTNGGFRSLCVNKLQVDEKNVKIEMGQATLKGVDQIKPVNPFIHQQAETTAYALSLQPRQATCLQWAVDAISRSWPCEVCFSRERPVCFVPRQRDTALWRCVLIDPTVMCWLPSRLARTPCRQYPLRLTQTKTAFTTFILYLRAKS